ncbi:MAG: HAMP domain-containing histidine kinase [Clostridiales bacterium]|nr:HAMP domain-containing histidine kinase [Clostridiales bacterium]
MVVKNVKKTAEQISAEENSADILGFIENAAYEKSLFIMITDLDGNIIYTADEHSGIYKKHSNNESDSGDNPYRSGDKIMNWQMGVYNNLPVNYNTALNYLKENNGCYELREDETYVYCSLLSNEWAVSNGIADGEAMLYISAACEAVGGAVEILHIQLIQTTLLSLLIGIIIAYFASKRFAAPLAKLSLQAQNIGKGNFEVEFEKGFCSEFDDLADTFKNTAEQLKQTDKFRREFLANISHDLRTPLTMIKGYGEAIRDFSSENKEDCISDASVIINEADRLTALVNDILEYSELREEKQIYKPEAVNISSLTKQVINEFDLICKNKQCIIKTDIEENLLVSADERLLERVLYNLIDNAISYSRQEGHIEIKIHSENNKVRTEIRDFGKGIPENELPYIWDRYFTLKQKKRNSAASGLGLAISKEILLLHKARFGADNAVGGGSIFWFELNTSIYK